MRHSCVVTLTRGETWSDKEVTEPYEAGWAREAMVFARGLDRGMEGVAHVQISPDGIRWCDFGSQLELHGGDELSFVRLREFGHFLRLRAELPEGIKRKFLITIALKS